MLYVLKEEKQALLVSIRNNTLNLHIRNIIWFQVLGCIPSFLQKIKLSKAASSLEYVFNYHNNNHTYQVILQTYLQQNAGMNLKDDTIISPIYLEDYDYQWGKVDFNNRTVLDIGADIGSTASFFVQKGAKTVIAVEGAMVCFKKLKTNSTRFGNVKPIFLFIKNSQDIEKLILNWNPDIIKFDIEGYEVHLLNIEDKIFRAVLEFIGEIHNDKLLSTFKEKCLKNSYDILSINPQSPSSKMPPYIVHAKKRSSG